MAPQARPLAIEVNPDFCDRLRRLIDDPRLVAQNIATAIDANPAPGGRLVAYQCNAHVARYLTPHLGTPRTAWEWRSLPPMRVFVWVKAAATAQ